MASFFWGPLSSFNEDWNVFVGGPIGPPENKKKNKFQQGPGLEHTHGMLRLATASVVISFSLEAPKSRPRERKKKSQVGADL